MTRFEYDGLPLKNVTGFQKHVETLTSSQTQFVSLLNEWFQKGRKENLFVLVSGGPGSGKTHTVVETLKYLDVDVITMAFQAKLAHRIGGRTVHSTMRLGFGEGTPLHRVSEQIGDSVDVPRCLEISSELQHAMRCDAYADIVVIDEIGMLPFWWTYQIYRYFGDHPVAIVCMGDPDQLSPVTSRNVFDVDLSPHVPLIEIQLLESKRFTPEYERIVQDLRELMKTTVVAEEEEEEEHPILEYLRTHYPVAPYITQEMLAGADLVLAFKNATVDACNHFYIHLLDRGEGEPLYEMVPLNASRTRIAADGVVEWPKIRKNCSVVVTENGCGDACNGAVLVCLNYDPVSDQVECEDRGTRLRVGRSKRTGKIPLVPGFAVTIHKFQGETIDDRQVVMCFDGSKNLHLIYTALSRVRDLKQIRAVVL